MKKLASAESGARAGREQYGHHRLLCAVHVIAL
jgi:hypothetical protein